MEWSLDANLSGNEAAPGCISERRELAPLRVAVPVFHGTPHAFPQPSRPHSDVCCPAGVSWHHERRRSDAHPPSTHRSLAHRFPSPARTQTTPFIPFLSHSPSPACISSMPSINILSRTVSPSHGTLTPSNPKPLNPALTRRWRIPPHHPFQGLRGRLDGAARLTVPITRVPVPLYHVSDPALAFVVVRRTPHSTPTVTVIMLIARPINMERHPTDRSRAALGARVVRGYGRVVARVRGLRGLGLGQSPCNY